MKVTTLHELFIHELKDAYSAEKQILQALPSIIKSARDEELKATLEAHRKQTVGHVERLTKVFEELGKKAQAHLCQATQGILAEGKEGLEQVEGPVVDLAITGSAERIEHYEQVVYTSLYEMAMTMKHVKAAELLKQTLEEEIEAGKKVAKLTKKLVKSVPVGHEV